MRWVSILGKEKKHENIGSGVVTNGRWLSLYKAQTSV